MTKQLLGKFYLYGACFGLGLLGLVYPAGLSEVQAKEPSVTRVEYSSSDLPDPFRSPFEVKPDEDTGLGPVVEYDLSHLRVQGMVWDSAIPQAIINNQVVRKGAIIDGAEITDIRKNGIYVLYEGRKYILTPTISNVQEGR